MRKLFCLFSLLTISLFSSASSEWLYYKDYPWVYDYHTKDWLYLRGSSDGEIYAYRSSSNAWEVFEVQEVEKTWEEKYWEWILEPEPYGGLEVLQYIKEHKDGGATELELWYKNISDLNPLSGLTNLTWLDLEDNNIADTTPLSGLTNLTWLDLGLNNITDLTPLAGLTNLTILHLWGNNISDLTPLTGLTNLDWLNLNYNNISDITPLAGLTNLRGLDLESNNISDITPLAGLTNLTILYLHENNITDLTPLEGLTNLRGLLLGGNNFSMITPLAGLTNLLELLLHNNNISDITPLAELTNLNSLSLSENNISDLSPLAGLTNLTILYLDENNITDITPLAGLKNLELLDLEDNLITASQKAMLEEALPNTYIFWPDVIIDEERSTSPKTAKLEIYTDSLDWEAIFKSRDDYVYTNYNVIDDGLTTGNLKVSISIYDPNYPSIQATSSTSVDISNLRSDENGDGIYDILDPDIFYHGSFAGTESTNYYNNNSYLGNVVFETIFDATRSSGQTFLQATIFATVTSSSISAIQVGQTFSVNRDYYTLGWSGTLEFDSTSYQASFSDNQTKVGYSANSQITQINESSITLKNFSLPNSLGTTTNTNISLTREGDIFHKQFVSNGITYYFRVLDIEDSNIDDSK
jgi:Leucine-rich repeat (LRR) protein